MLVYSNYILFKIMNEEIYLYSEDIGNGKRNTVAEIDEDIHYLGDEPCNIASAIFAWQDLNSRELTGDELHQVLLDNNLVSSAV